MGFSVVEGWAGRADRSLRAWGGLFEACAATVAVLTGAVALESANPKALAPLIGVLVVLPCWVGIRVLPLLRRTFALGEWFARIGEAGRGWFTGGLLAFAFVGTRFIPASVPINWRAVIAIAAMLSGAIGVYGVSKEMTFVREQTPFRRRMKRLIVGLGEVASAATVGAIPAIVSGTVIAALAQRFLN